MSEDGMLDLTEKPARHGWLGLGRDKPLRLYWWNKKDNFGDMINPAIVASVSGRKIAWASPARAELLAIGSVLNFAKGRLTDAKSQKAYVWGSGSLNYPSWINEIEDTERFVAVRGGLTASIIKNFEGAMGDPGLLCPLVCEPSGSRSGVGVIPHYGTWENKIKMDALRATGYRLIDVRKKDPWEVVREISSCEMILSSSLHGLVVADAYGIPNYWIAGTGRYKFYDYFYTLGRRVARPLTLKECAARIAADDFDDSYFKVIPEIRDSLIAAFPDGLKG